MDASSQNFSVQTRRWMEPDWCPGEVRGHPARKAFRRNTLGHGPWFKAGACEPRWGLRESPGLTVLGSEPLPPTASLLLDNTSSRILQEASFDISRPLKGPTHLLLKGHMVWEAGHPKTHCCIVEPRFCTSQRARTSHVLTRGWAIRKSLRRRRRACKHCHVPVGLC